MFANRFRELRKSKGLSQEQIAETCGVSRQTVSKWESGFMMPEMDKLLIISEFFNVTLDYLLKGTEIPSSIQDSTPTTVFSFEKICEMLLPRRNKMEVLYEDAALYDVIYDDSRNEIIRQLWNKLNLEQYGIKSIHDCSIGTGQMTISLAMLGFDVSGSDISKDMLAKCKENSKHYNVNIPTIQCDFRELSSHVTGTYDCVMSTGNSLGHVENKDVVLTLHEMDKLVKPNGYIYFDLRNWDKILKDHQRFYLYNPFFVNNERVNLIQVWDYNLDGTITFNMVYTFEENNKLKRHKISSIYYYPINRKFITDELKNMGYTIMFEKPFPDTDMPIQDCEWYQILAKKN